MGLSAGRYTLGPDVGTLAVHTKRGGAIAKAGHDLLIHVTDWTATLEISDTGTPTAIELSADSRSMNVIEGTGGMTTLGDDDKKGIAQTINEEVLGGAPIVFRSREVTADGRRVTVSGNLELTGRTQPVTFTLELSDSGRLTGTASLTQSRWGIKPYTALFGTLKVLDDVTVEVDAQLPEPATAH